MQAKSSEPVTYVVSRVDDDLPGNILARIKIKDQTIWLLQVIDGRSPRVDFDDARLHEADQSCGIVNREHRLFVTGIDTADPLVQPLPRMFGEKALGSRARGATQQAQWTAGNMRENPIGYVDVEVGQALLGDSRFFPENSLWMREADANWSWRNAEFRSLRRRLQNDFLSRLVIPEALEGRRPKQSVAGPTAVFDLANEARLRPPDAFLGAGGERFCE